jgi:hypothetical protein
MGSFDSGFRMGQQAYQQNIDNERQKTLDGYRADEVARQKVTWGREDTQRADEDAALANLQNVRTGISPEQQGQIKQTYGMTPQQTAAAGPNLQSKLASYDAPDSYDLQNAPAEGAAPAFNASGLKLKRGSDLEMERAGEQVSLAKRDVNGAAQSRERQRTYGIREISDATAKMPLAELEKQLPQLNTNNSQYPILYTGKSNGGYSFLTTEPDGTPGNAFSMNEAQVRQLASAHALGEAGYGAESLSALTAAHKDISDHITKRNDVTAKTNVSNNTANHYANSDANDSERIGIARGSLRLQTRTADRVENPFTAKVADYEKATGVSMTLAQKEVFAGLGKEESAHMKALVGGLTEGVKQGTITPEQFTARVNEVYAFPKRVVQESRYVNGLREAKKAGRLDEALAGLKSRNVSAEDIARYSKDAGIEAPAAPAAEDSNAIPPAKAKSQSTGLVTPQRRITTLAAPRTAADMNPAATGPVGPPSQEEDFARYLPFLGGAPLRR